MDIKVQGGQKLCGEIIPSGSKNSAVAIIPATILFDQPITLENIPEIDDVSRLVKILKNLGSKIDWDKKARRMRLDNSNLKFAMVKEEDWSMMRGTSLLWGPMLARFKKITFSGLPGGCTLGFRTLDPHFQAFKSLGIEVREKDKGIIMDAKKAKAASFWLDEMSPTATENALLLAAALPGKSEIIGAASEPQVQDLCRFLETAGVKINGIGSSCLTVAGGYKSRSFSYKLFSDHYEVATFLAFAALTGGKIKVRNLQPGLFVKINEVFSRFGIEIKYEKDSAIVDDGQKIKIISRDRDLLVIKAQPWPGLPVDLLPLFIPLAIAAEKGQVLFHNWMYEAGLFWTSELMKLGANIVMCDPHRILVISGAKLKGETMEAPYIIRAVVAMVMAGMIAEGESRILNADVLYRGHPHFSENLKKLGAKIEEIK